MNRKLVAITGALLGACTPASCNDSDNFRVMRRVVFVNGISDNITSKTVEEDWMVLV